MLRAFAVVACLDADAGVRPEQRLVGHSPARVEHRAPQGAAPGVLSKERRTRSASSQRNDRTAVALPASRPGAPRALVSRVAAAAAPAARRRALGRRLARDPPLPQPAA